jgi:ATP-grasp domain, R2K clade family 3
MIWLIQENQDDLLTVAVVKDVLDGLAVRWIPVIINFNSLSLAPLEGLQESGSVICYGPSFIRRIEHGAKWHPGSIFDPTTFTWSRFQSGWKDLMLARDGRVTSIRSLRESTSEGAIFIRPDADSKAFEGGIRSSRQLRELVQSLSPDLEVITASVVAIDAEYRIFVVGSEVVAASEYRRGGKPALDGFVPNNIVDLALEADRLWRPADSYVIDIARSGSRVGIVEANCIMGARHYAADTRAIVAALSRHYQ